MSEQNQLPFPPAGWVLTALDYFCAITQGQSPPSSTYNTEGTGLPFFQGKAEFGDIYPTIKKWSAEPSKTAEEGDILISIRAPVGPTNLAPTKVAIGRGLAAIHPLGGISNRYILYALRNTQGELAARGTGSTFAAISGDVLRSHKLPLAPVAEQHRIVDEIEKQFSRLNVAVEMLQRVERNLERLRAATLKAAVEGRLVPTEARLARTEGRDYEPADVLLQRILRERHAKWEADQLANMRERGKRLKDDKWKANYEEPDPPDAIDLTEIPEGWVLTTLRSIAEIKGGITKGQQRSSADVLRTVPYLRVANVQRGYLDLHEIKTIEATEAEIEALKLLSGDILFTEGGDRDKLGRGWIWRNEIPECIHQNHVFRARLYRDQIQPKYISWYGNTYGQDYFTKQGKQTTNLASINITKLGSFPIPIPPAAEQSRIVAEVERRISVIEELKTLVGNALRRGTILCQKILRDAFNGKLVPQDSADEPAEKILERIRLEKAESEKLKKTPSRRAPSKTSRKKKPSGKRAMQELPLITKGGEQVDGKEPIRARDIKFIRLKLNGEYKALLDFDQTFRIEGETRSALSPVCLVGLNGSGKSNLIEALSEIFCYLELINLPYEGITQRAKQKEMDFEIEYELPSKGSRSVRIIKISKRGNQPPTFIERVGDEEIQIVGPGAQLAILPTWIIGYSSGLNETISIPYFKTKAFYSEDVRNRAFNISKRKQMTETFTESRTLFMDYDSNAAILIANYIFGSRNQLDLFRERIRIDDIASFDVVIRLKYGGNKPVKLTAELAEYIDRLRECASDRIEDDDKQSTFRYEVDANTRQKIRNRFNSAKDFFIGLYKLSLLNALALKGEDRKFYLRPDVKEGLLERPPTVSKSDKIFDIDRLKLKLTEPSKVIDYAGISDGEHQFIHIFGTIKLFDDSGTLFLLDEPETHFNPRWRREFVELLNGVSSTEKQEFVISTHSPYIVSGCRKENVFKFERKGDRAFCHPVDFETYGSSFEYLLTKLFDLDSLISKQAFEDMRDVIKSKDLTKLEAAVNDFGESFEKRFLFEEIARAKKRG